MKELGHDRAQSRLPNNLSSPLQTQTLISCLIITTISFRLQVVPEPDSPDRRNAKFDEITDEET